MRINRQEQTESILKLWIENNVNYVNFEFSCGGDSMNDTSITIFNKEGNEIELQELEDYIDEVIYDRVEFYVNSDGHYQGEFGNVEITLEEGDDDLTYIKSSQSEWCESVFNELLIDLDEATLNLVKSKVLNINGGDGEINTNYKEDCILNDKEEELIELLEEKIQNECRDFCPEDDMDGDVSDWHTFTTNEEGEELKIVNGSLAVQIRNEINVIKDE